MAAVKGGQKAAKRLAELDALLRKVGTLRVGFLENARYPDGTPVAMVAAIQDYGAPRAGIPPRPFFRNMVRKKSPGWPKAAADLLIANRMDADLTLRQMGEGIKGQLQQSIQETNAPPLKPATIKRKGFSKPLIDTSHMIKSVDFDVK